jgi:hypothetical protein
VAGRSTSQTTSPTTWPSAGPTGSTNAASPVGNTYSAPVVVARTQRVIWLAISDRAV